MMFLYLEHNLCCVLQWCTHLPDHKRRYTCWLWCLKDLRYYIVILLCTESSYGPMALVDWLNIWSPWLPHTHTHILYKLCNGMLIRSNQCIFKIYSGIELWRCSVASGSRPYWGNNSDGTSPTKIITALIFFVAT